MALSQIFDNATDAFEAMFSLIMKTGIKTNIGTKAVYNACITILNPTDRDIKTPWRKWSKTYAEREWAWYVSRDRSVSEIKKYAPIWDKMHNGDNIVNSNYGWQWNRNEQLELTIQQLSNNPNTRQAWISIFDGKEKSEYAYDTPCTIAIGFDIKPGSKNLDMTVIMRSNDLIYGFCNDQYCFSKLQISFLFHGFHSEIFRELANFTFVIFLPVFYFLFIFSSFKFFFH